MDIDELHEGVSGRMIGYYVLEAGYWLAVRSLGACGC